MGAGGPSWPISQQAVVGARQVEMVLLWSQQRLLSGWFRGMSFLLGGVTPSVLCGVGWICMSASCASAVLSAQLAACS